MTREEMLKKLEIEIVVRENREILIYESSKKFLEHAKSRVEQLCNKKKYKLYRTWFDIAITEGTLFNYVRDNSNNTFEGDELQLSDIHKGFVANIPLTVLEEIIELKAVVFYKIFEGEYLEKDFIEDCI